MARIITREEWLIKAVKELRRQVFAPAGIEVPELAVSCGFPGGGSARKRIGECWATKASDDQATAQVFVSPILDGELEVLAVLAHELVHVVDDCENGHKAPFVRMMKLIGLTGKPTATGPGEELTMQLVAIADKIGEYPHSKINLSDANVKKQTTRMLKVVCPEDDYTVRTTRKWLDDLGTPTCPCGTRMEEAG